MLFQSKKLRNNLQFIKTVGTNRKKICRINKQNRSSYKIKRQFQLYFEKIWKFLKWSHQTPSHLLSVNNRQTQPHELRETSTLRTKGHNKNKLSRVKVKISVRMDPWRSIIHDKIPPQLTTTLSNPTKHHDPLNPQKYRAHNPWWKFTQ